jgi:UDP-N-acetylmuramyl pentapeptide phosphotransferase/UDP-N-acetylglucosamine-1-phosphate transferase
MSLIDFGANVQLIMAVVFAFLITFVFVPITVGVAKAKGIVAHENGRTSHKGNIPTMGGLAVFAGFYVSVMMFVNDVRLPEMNAFLAGSFLILLSGMKDDIVGISARKKFFIQIIAACILIFWADLRFTNLQGFLGIYEINYFWSVCITLITIVGLTNCFNLIDGIDGLATGVSVVSLVSLGLWFFFVGQSGLMMISFILAACLLSFVPFNVFGKENKIFLGDTGSLTAGFIVAFLIIKFNQVNLTLAPVLMLKSAPALSIAIVFVPLFDTLRVFAIRVINKRNPFSPDKLHAHHTLLSLGLNHAQTSLFLVCLNVATIFLAYSTSSLGTTALVFILLSLGIVVFFIPCALRRMKQNKPIFSLTR